MVGRVEGISPSVVDGGEVEVTAEVTALLAAFAEWEGRDNTVMLDRVGRTGAGMQRLPGLLSTQ